MSRCRTPSGASASLTALSSAGSAPTVPASPTPLAPSGLTCVGTSWEATPQKARAPRGADALGAERFHLRRHLMGVHLEERQVVGARHRVVHERAGQELAGLAIVGQVLEEPLGQPPHDPPLDPA